MNKKEIAKNLLLDKTCDTCKFHMGNKCTKNEADIPEENTCSLWEEFVGLVNDLFKVVRMNYPNIIASKIIEIQPMKKTKDDIYYIDYKFEDEDKK